MHTASPRDMKKTIRVFTHALNIRALSIFSVSIFSGESDEGVFERHVLTDKASGIDSERAKGRSDFINRFECIEFEFILDLARIDKQTVSLEFLNRHVCLKSVAAKVTQKLIDRHLGKDLAIVKYDAVINQSFKVLDDM